MDAPDLIASFAPFRDLPAPSRLQLARGLRYRVFPKAARVLSRADIVAGAYIVLVGRLRVYTMSAGGREATLYEIRPGETCVLALNCLFNDLRYPAWVDAAPGTKVAIIDGPSYRWLFEHEADVRDMTIRALSSTAFRLMQALEDVQTRPLDRRLAGFLLVHASSSGEVAMTQQAIADQLGTTREVVARLLGQFARARLVVRRRGRVLLPEPKRLARWARGSQD